MTAPPLRSHAPIVAAGWPAASEAARLLSHLGAGVSIEDGAHAALASGAVAVEAARSSVAMDWAGSGAMAITGRADGPLLHPVGRPATIAKAAALALQLLTGTSVDGAALLGERAALMRLHRQGQISAGGGTRLLPAADGWWALNLARDTDLVPALIETDAAADHWAQLARWAATRPTATIIDRTIMLGLAAGALGETRPPNSPWRITTRTAAQPSTTTTPLVVNLGALWAGPLAAHLLALGGAHVIEVESRTRPDPTRHTNPEFHALLHHGHDRRRLDFTAPAELRELLHSADVIIESSRPRALTALGADPATIMTDQRPRTWLRITGHRDPDRVAFGDDAAVSGGLIAWDNDQPAFAADAIADPLTGLLGALAVAACQPARNRTLIEISMADAAAYCASGPPHRSSQPATEPHLARREQLN